MLTTFVATAVAQKNVNDAGVALAGTYTAPAVSSVNHTEATSADSDRSAPPATGVSYTNPVLAGNYPDPSVVRVGKDYWATATSSGWAPQFPILHSRDLVNWSVAGSVFQQRPAWSDGNYWAPEITHHRGQYFVYYVARKIGGGRCVAVATSRQPTGPYQDHGPLVCQKLGSIDPMAIRDEHGQPYLVWKRGGNTRNLPTPILAQKLSKDGLRLIGERTELIRNDAAWEAKVVEAPFIVRRGGWFYMFYSGDDCCSLQCNYALGVARSPYLLGPWEKNPANPILKGNETWKCPGHGSVVRDAQGLTYLLYHAFQRDAVYVGRQALLDEVKWGANQWPTINAGNAPSGQALSPHGIEPLNAEFSFVDDFTSSGLTPGWQWPQANQPSARLDVTRNGWLALSPARARAHDVVGAVMARPTTAGDYVVTTAADTRDMRPGALAGLAAFGDSQNALGIAVGGGKVIVWRREQNSHKIVATAAAPNAPLVHLRMIATGGYRFQFAVGQNGQDWRAVGNKKGIDLPPWDHAVRVALTSGGAQGASARFDGLRIVPSMGKPATDMMLAGT
ncbi:MAG: family 43 glycosylhydrolase [Gammaproteobacteria bacterium]